MRRSGAKKHASRMLSTSALSLPATGTPSIPTAADSEGKKLVKTSLNSLIQALKLTKGVSSACPQLHSAVEALLIVLEAYKRYSEATVAIEALLSRTKSLNDILEKIPSEDSCPQALKERLASLASNLQDAAEGAKRMKSKRRIIQFLNAADYAERIESWVKKLDEHIHNFLLEGTITLEMTVHQGFYAIDKALAHDALRKALRPVVEAFLHSGSSVHVQCHEDTRKEVLAMLRSWLRPDHPPLSDRAILWLHALAGSGKSTIALTISERWEKDKLLGASFFCSRDGQRSDINSIFRTIAYQLALHFPAFREQLTKILETDPDLFSSNPTRQLEKLIVAPLQAVQSDGKSETLFPAQVAVVVDALDECTDTAAVSTVLKSLALYIDQLAPLKFLITSRPEENITRGFLLRCLERNTQTLALNKIPGDLTRRDISAFLQSRLDEIRDNFALNTSWPVHQQLENLVDLSELLFIFTAAAVRYIGDQAERDPENRLTSLLDAGNAAAAKRGTSTSPFTILDALYTQVLETAVRKLGPVLKARLKAVLGTIVLAEQRLSPTTLESLLELPSGTVRRVLPVLSSILTIPDREDDTTPIRIIHLSFPNFLIDHTRCTDQSFLVQPRIQHSHIAFRCLYLMQALKYNILEVASEHDCALNSEFPDLLVKISQYLPAALQYACKYWTHHLCEAEIGEDLVAALEGFCGSHLLHWLEVLSLLGCVDGVVMALQSVQAFLKTQSLRATDVQSLLYDCERAVRAFYPIISTSAIHMYSTVALFAPLNSPIRQFAAADAQTSLVVRVGLENTWSDTLLSRVIGRCFVEDCAFSPDGMCVAFTKRNGTIQLLNACTGAELQIFKSHASKSPIRSCSFSPAGKELLSGSDDGSVNLWDVATGANLNTWKAHSDWVFSVAWSPDGTLAASASDDKTVRLWRVAFPEDMVLLHHGGWVFHIVFAPDGDLLSGSSDGMCKVWDTRRIGWGTEPTQTLKHHSEVLTVAVSSDSSLVACGLDNGEIVLWTKSDGRQLRSLPGGSAVISLELYPSGLLAAAYNWSSFTLWDISTGIPLKSASHEGASAAAFAPDGLHIAHVTDNQLHIHLWPSELKQNAIRTTSITGKLKQLARHPTVEDRELLGNRWTVLQADATSPRRKLILAVSDGELRIYDVSTGRCMRTIDHPSDTSPYASWSPTGKLFACTGRDHAVHVWKTGTGELVGSFTGHPWYVTGVFFTPDEQYILSASWDGLIHRGKIGKSGQEMTSEVLFQSVGDQILAFAVSSDGRWILSATYQHRSPLDTSNTNLLVSPSRQLVEDNVGNYNALRLHDATTGRVIWIERHRHFITSVAFTGKKRGG